MSFQNVNQRNASLDFLRVGATLAVVWLHVSAGVVLDNPDVHSMSWWTGNIADAFSRWCVPVFVMISGALVFSNTKNGTLGEFYKNRAMRLFPPLVFWTAVYLVLRAQTEDDFNVKIAANALVSGKDPEN